MINIKDLIKERRTLKENLERATRYINHIKEDINEQFATLKYLKEELQKVEKELEPIKLEYANYNYEKEKIIQRKEFESEVIQWLKKDNDYYVVPEFGLYKGCDEYETKINNLMNIYDIHTFIAKYENDGWEFIMKTYGEA